MRTFLIALAGIIVSAIYAASARASAELDTSFGQSGFAFTGFSSLGLDNNAAPNAVVVQSDGKIVVAGAGFALTSGFNCCSSAFVLARFNANGTPDTTFGIGGKLATSFLQFNEAVAAAIQPSDGKIVVAGGVSQSSFFASNSETLAVARYTPSGALDPTFGVGGKVTTAIGAGGGVAAVAIQGDGRILVAGTVNRSDTAKDFLVVRLLSNGALDTSFGATHSGSFVLPNPLASIHTDFGGEESANAIAVQGDGKIVVAGATIQFNATNSQFALARYNSDGSLDSTFGGAGRVTTNFALHSGTFNDDAAFGSALQADGKIVAVGRTETDLVNLDHKFAVARYNPNGILDTTFGSGGKVTTSFDPSFSDTDNQAFAVVVQPDGRIVAAGVTDASGPSTFALARYNSNGTLDTAFGAGGFVTTDKRGQEVQALAIQQTLPTGRLIAAGFRGDLSASPDCCFAIARFNAYTLQLTKVGGFALAPAASTASVNQHFDYALTWTVPDPENWHDLNTLQLRLRDGSDVALVATFDEASGSFSVLNAAGRAGPSAMPGSNQVLQTPDAALYMADAKVIASDPSSPTVTLLLPLNLKPKTAGHSFVVEVAATDDFGNQSSFVQAGTLDVQP